MITILQAKKSPDIRALNFLNMLPYPGGVIYKRGVLSLHTYLVTPISKKFDYFSCFF